MKRQAPEISDQGPEDTAEVLRRVLPPVGHEPEMRRDLWPSMERRLRQRETLRAVPWFDWALAGAVAVVAVAFPASVPVLLYYL